MIFILLIDKIRWRRIPVPWLGLLFVILYSTLSNAAEPTTETPACVPQGGWLIPETGEVADNAEVMARIANKRVILVGEHHQNLAHHLWQLDVLTRLHASRNKIALAVEMLPRKSQAALNQWLQGEFPEAAFAQKTKWSDSWFYDVELYMPLFLFARRNQIPVFALNVDRALFNKVSKLGWDAVPDAEREGVSTPARATRPYLRQLAQSYNRHDPLDVPGEMTQEKGEKFARFVEVQLLWDRAMAEGIANILSKEKKTTVVAFMGSGHMMNGFGAPNQLSAMGIEDIAILIPWDSHLDCNIIKPGFADAVYGPPAIH